MGYPATLIRPEHRAATLRAVLRAVDDGRIDDAMLLIADYSPMAVEAEARASALEISEHDFARLLRTYVAAQYSERAPL